MRRRSILTLVCAAAVAACGAHVSVEESAGQGGQPATATTGSAMAGGGSVGGAGGTAAGGTGAGGTMSWCVPGEQQPCYDAPADTMGVGICSAGTAVCQDDGAALGPCEQQVLPEVESCATLLDEDCDGWVNEECGATTLESAAFGGSTGDRGWAVAYDPAGNLFVGGEFSSPTMTVGTETLQKNGGGDGWVAKLDGMLDPIWLRGVSGPGDQHVETMASDVAGRVAFAGNSFGDVDLGGGTLPAAPGKKGFVGVYDPGGQYQWGHVLSGDGDSAISAITILPGGDVVVTGSFDGTLSVAGLAAVSSAGSHDGFLIRFLGATGQPLWANRYGTVKQEELLSVAATPNGDLLVAGAIPNDGDLDFGGGGVTMGKRTLAVARLTGGGGHLWSNGFAGLRLFALDVASGPDGDMYLAGGLDSPSDFGGGTLQADDDIFVARLDPAGQHVFSRVFGNGDAMQKANALAVDSLGAVVVTGRVLGGASGIVDVGGGPVTVSEGMFVAKYTPTGEHQWSSIYENTVVDALDVAASSFNTSAVTGHFNGMLNLGNGPLVSQSSNDILVAVFAP